MWHPTFTASAGSCHQSLRLTGWEGYARHVPQAVLFEPLDLALWPFGVAAVEDGHVPVVHPGVVALKRVVVLDESGWEF